MSGARALSPGGPATRPWAVLVSGAPGTGKSTLATALTPRLGAAVLDLDVATGPLTAVVSGLIGRADLGDPAIAALTRTPRYETLYALAAENLRAGRHVVLVAPFTVEQSAAGWQAVADRLGAHASALVLLWLHLPPERLVARLTRRGAARDTAKVHDPAAFLAATGSGPPAVPHIALDATRPVTDLVGQALARLAHLGLAIDGSP